MQKTYERKGCKASWKKLILYNSIKYRNKFAFFFYSSFTFIVHTCEWFDIDWQIWYKFANRLWIYVHHVCVYICWNDHGWWAAHLPTRITNSAMKPSIGYVAKKIVFERIKNIWVWTLSYGHDGHQVWFHQKIWKRYNVARIDYLKRYLAELSASSFICDPNSDVNRLRVWSARNLSFDFSQSDC